jgi:8-oxo-dGTP pyrophosphatase MutT (NUDIX family)
MAQDKKTRKASKIKTSFKREFSAGGAVFKKEKGKVLWLIIKPAGTDRWQLPKGLIDPGEKVEKTALREVEEEGRVKANLIKKIKDITYFYFFEGQKIFKKVTYFLMEYLEDSKQGSDAEVDEARFLPFDEAEKKLTFRNEQEVLKKARGLLNNGIQQNLV